MSILILYVKKSSPYKMHNIIATSISNLGISVGVMGVREFVSKNISDISAKYGTIFMVKNKGIQGDRLKQISRYIKTFYYINDAITSKRKWILSQAADSCYVAGTSAYTCRKLSEYESKNVSQIYQGYNTEWFYPMNAPLMNKSIFIGNLHDKSRKKIMRDLAKKSFDITHINNIHPLDTNAYFNKYKININFCGSRGFSNRCIRILGSGGFLLSQYDEDLEHTFGNGCVLWKTTDDLIDKAKYYIDNDDERNKIARIGHKLIQSYTWDDQSKKILRAMDGEIIIDGSFLKK